MNIDREEEKRKRASLARAKKKASEETIEDAFDRIGIMKLSDKEREIFQLAKEAFFKGKIGRLSNGKMNKGEVLSMGMKVQQDQNQQDRSQRIREVLENKPTNFHILTDDRQLPMFINRVREECRLQMEEWKDRFQLLGVESMTAGDFEGSGVDSYMDLSIGFGIWLPVLQEGYYLPYGHVDLRNDLDISSKYAFRYGDKQLTRSRVIEVIAPYIKSSKHGKTFHMGSARYDLHIAQNDGYTIRGCKWDTLDGMYLMTEHLPSYGLKPLLKRYGNHIDQFYQERYGQSLGLGEKEVYTFEDLFGKGSPAPFNTEIVGIYGIWDVLYGWALFEWQFETMKQTGRLIDCYSGIDSHLSAVDVFMARCGFEIDIEGLSKLEEEFQAKLDIAKKDLFNSYQIDHDFLRKMSLTINGEKIRVWQQKQKDRNTKLLDQIAKYEGIVSDCIHNKKQHLKKYINAVEMVCKYKEQLTTIRIDERDAPDYINSFELTNNRHIAYLIYDFLEIEDRTPRFKKGKKRSTSADILEVYYKEEEALKPLRLISEYEKLLNTYVRKIPTAFDADGRFHTEWKSGGTSTGRYSSSGYRGRPIDLLNRRSSI